MIPGDEISFAGAGGSGTELESLRRQIIESEGKDGSIFDSNKDRQFEDVDENKETNGGCTDENIVTVNGYFEGASPAWCDGQSGEDYSIWACAVHIW
jgi:hypothetical protein